MLRDNQTSRSDAGSASVGSTFVYELEQCVCLGHEAGFGDADRIAHAAAIAKARRFAAQVVLQEVGSAPGDRTTC